MEYHGRAARNTIIFALLGLLLWGADWATDAEHAKKALFYRLAIAALLLISAAIKSATKTIYLHVLANYLALVVCEIALVLLLAGLQGGPAAGSGQFIFFLLGSLLLGGLYPYNLNLLGCAALVLVPQIAGALLTPAFPHVLYASTVWPAGAFAMLAHGRIRQLVVENARLRNEVEASALIDPVTGLLNMRGLEQAFQRMVKLGAFKPLQQFLLLIEIDGLEKLAAEHGKDLEPSLRGQLAQVIDLSFRSRDITASPTEEFACILQHVSREKAFDIAERFRGIVADQEFNCAHAESSKLKCTVSIGIVSADAKDEIKSLINQARVGVSQASSRGGNQCVCI